MERMNLHEFVDTTLVETVQGVRAAISATSTLDETAVNPRESHGNLTKARDAELDVAATASGTTEGGGRAKLSVVGIEIGGHGGGTIQNTAVGRIRFTVPISLPSRSSPQFKTMAKKPAEEYDPRDKLLA